MVKRAYEEEVVAPSGQVGKRPGAPAAVRKTTKVQPPRNHASIAAQRRNKKQRGDQGSQFEESKRANHLLAQLLAKKLGRPRRPARRNVVKVRMYEVMPSHREKEPDSIYAHRRRRDFAVMRSIFEFRKVNPADAILPASCKEIAADDSEVQAFVDEAEAASRNSDTPIDNQHGLMHSVVYAEYNDQAKYATLLVGDGIPGRLCVVGKMIVWDPIKPGPPFNKYGHPLLKRIELQFNEHSKSSSHVEKRKANLKSQGSEKNEQLVLLGLISVYPCCGDSRKLSACRLTQVCLS